MIIGLSGKQGVGKSTLASYIMYLAKKNKTETSVVKIAGLIYELQDMIYEKLDMQVVGEKDRPLLIALGMHFRKVNENFWTDKAMDKARALSNAGHIVIIDDIRFPNEAKAVEDAGGLLVRIEGIQRGRNISIEAMSTPSECALDDYNFRHRINNRTSKLDTEKQLRQVLRTFLTT